MSEQRNTSPLPPEATALERRVLAHERILQSLLAYMSRSDPRFVEHLQARFVLPMSRVSHEHDYKETDEYAEDFIRAVMRLEAKGRSGGDKPKQNPNVPKRTKRHIRTEIFSNIRELMFLKKKTKSFL